MSKKEEWTTTTAAAERWQSRATVYRSAVLLLYHMQRRGMLSSGWGPNTILLM